MIDLAPIKANNAARRALHKNASTPPWNIYKSIWRAEDRAFVAFARSDNAEDVIDELVAEIEQLRDDIGELRNPTYWHVPVG